MGVRVRQAAPQVLFFAGCGRLRRPQPAKKGSLAGLRPADNSDSNADCVNPVVSTRLSIAPGPRAIFIYVVACGRNVPAEGASLCTDFANSGEKLFRLTPGAAQHEVDRIDCTLSELRAKVRALPIEQQAAFANEIYMMIEEQARARNALNEALDDRYER